MPLKLGELWKTGALCMTGALCITGPVGPKNPAGGAENPPCEPEKPPWDPPRCAPASVANQATITATAARRFIARFYAQIWKSVSNSDCGCWTGTRESKLI